MTFLVTLIVTVVACFALAKAVHKVPWLFYLLAIACDLVLIGQGCFPLPHNVTVALLWMVQKCILPLALFTVVMYIGCFSKDSLVSHRLRPIRAELSIIAWLLALGHMVVYLMGYLPRIFGGKFVDGNVLAAFVIAVVLFALLLVLGVTSFNVVKKHMHRATWTRVQKLAYLFFALVYVHLALMLMPAAIAGSASAQANVLVYSIVFALYVIMRLCRLFADRRLQNDSKRDAGEQKDRKQRST